MRKPVQLSLIALVVLLLGATGYFYNQYRKTSANYATMLNEEQATRVRYGEAINSIAAIQDSLNAIGLGDSTVQLIGHDMQTEQRLTSGQREAVMERISSLKAGVERTKAMIVVLDGRLKKSGVKVAGLERMVSRLKSSVTQKEEMVAALTTRVDSLQTQVTGLVAEVQVHESTIQEQAQQIENKRRELGTIYYVVGNKRDLKQSGVVVAKGGLLGIGKTLKPTGNFDESRFTAIDTDQETVVHIPAAKVQVLTAQPASSYQLQVNGDQTELIITDPVEFRKTKHLVILTT